MALFCQELNLKRSFALAALTKIGMLANERI
jgi:hypothetical protein